ncbi:MAG: GDYXXLXY domain-containing protein [Verrucomicrobiota bacterium]
MTIPPTKHLVSFGFLATALLQLAILASCLFLWETTLHHGQVLKLRCAPVDPYDAFRGRYVSLRLEGQEATYEGRNTRKRGSTVFATLQEGEEGFAHFAALTARAPKEVPYVRVQLLRDASPQQKVAFRVPFDRYFLNEKLAPEAEIAYREANRREPGQGRAWVELRVRHGIGIIESVQLENESLEEAARRRGGT